MDKIKLEDINSELNDENDENDENDNFDSKFTQFETKNGGGYILNEIFDNEHFNPNPNFNFIFQNSRNLSIYNLIQTEISKRKIRQNLFLQR